MGGGEARRMGGEEDGRRERGEARQMGGEEDGRREGGEARRMGGGGAKGGVGRRGGWELPRGEES